MFHFVDTSKRLTQGHALYKDPSEDQLAHVTNRMLPVEP